ncbi:4-alpha-glucanotransferase [bacterium HR19]|nr:4-alpha-glucanotransferase [bacterium HR19]
MIRERRAGILIHITSLPSDFGVGDIKSGFEFVDFLERSGQTLWQILPIHQTSSKFGNSPYHPLSTFAGNYILISPEKLLELGLIKREDLEEIKVRSEKTDYKNAYFNKRKILKKAFEKFRWNDEIEKFFSENTWLKKYCAFSVIRERSGKEWYEWDEETRWSGKDEKIAEKVRNKMRDEFDFFVFEQFIFFSQWIELKKYANSKGIFIIGDLPIYVSYESCDVWENTHIFKIDRDGKPKYVSGVPPDFFSITGQLWGTPVYDWNELEREEFSWWIKRLNFSFQLYDYVRIDHFRGFIAYWEVPYGEKTAEKGRWIKAPAEKFFRTVFRKIANANIIAEDLGFITEDVKYIRELFKIPGMKVLQFGFYGDDQEHLPHNADKNSVIYTGTHDNPPSKAWFRTLDENAKKRFELYTGKKVSEEDIHFEMIRLAYSSPSNFAIIPMQDILGLGEEARMNTPAKPSGNWEWKMNTLPREEISEKIRELSKIFGR